MVEYTLMEENKDGMGKIGLLKWIITMSNFRFFFTSMMRRW
jgi:hypothetical protein